MKITSKSSVIGALIAVLTLAVSLGVVAPAQAVDFTPPTVTVFFDSYKSNLTAEDHKLLDEAIPTLATATSLRIVGYVQRSKNPKKFEVPLSLQRAQAVADYLTREMGKYVGKEGTVPEITVVRGGLPSSWAGKPTARRADVFATF